MTQANQVQCSPGLSINTPGQPVTNNIPLPVQVGMFPPNSNNQGGGTVLAAMSAAGANGQPTLAANMLITNEGVGNSLTLAAALSTGTDGGNASSPANGIPFGSAAGGNGLGAGGSITGANGDTALAGQAPAINVTFEGGSAAPHYAG